MLRLRAFTLLEVTIALLLTGLLAVLAYAIILNITVASDRSFHLHDRMDEIRDIHTRIQSDLDRAKLIVRSANGIAIGEGTSQIVIYTCSSGYLLRAAGASTDTLSSEGRGLQCFWQGTSVPLPDAPVDLIRLTLGLQSDTTALVLRKDYDAVTLHSLIGNHAYPGSYAQTSR